MSSRPGVITRTLLGFSRALGRALVSEETARQAGLLQSFDPRTRLIGLALLVVAVTLAHKFATISAILLLALVMAVASRLSLAMLAQRVWLPVLAFTGVIALPALFLTPGTALGSGASRITAQGMHTALLLILRVETAVTCTTLLILTTPWNHVLKALRTLRVPQEVILMLAMTHRYIFLLVETANQMFESRQSRTVGLLPPAQQRHMLTQSAGVLLSKSIALSNDVFQAMQSRGFTGDVRLLSDFRLRARDYFALAFFALVAIAAIWVGRS